MGAVDELDRLFLLPDSVNTLLGEGEFSSRLVEAMPKLREVRKVCLSNAIESQRERLAQGLATAVYETAVIFDRLHVDFFNFALRSQSISRLVAAVREAAPPPPALITAPVWLAAARSLSKKRSYPSAAQRNKRLRWTGVLKDAFVEAVEQLGGPFVAKPAKVFAKMDNKDITYTAVANYLKKYRKEIKEGSASV